MAIDAEKACKIGGGCGCLGFFIFVICISVSFSKLEYYEYGFSKRSTTGAVDRSKVYGPGGNFYLGPDYTFVTFPADQIHVEQNDLDAWSKKSAGDAGTSVMIDISFQYQLVAEELPLLFDKRNINFKPFVENLALQVCHVSSCTACLTGCNVHWNAIGGTR